MGLRMLMIPFAWTSVDSTPVSGRKAFLELFFQKNNIFLDNCFPVFAQCACALLQVAD